MPPTRSKGSDHPQLAELLGLSADQLPPLKIIGCHLQRGPQGELLASCPKVPSDPGSGPGQALEGRVGYHVDNKNPEKKELVFGYNHIRTTHRNEELELELPVGNSTYPANTNEGNRFNEHRSKVSLPLLPERVEVLDGAYDQTPIYQEVRRTQGIPLIAYNPRNEKLSPEALLERGYDENGTP